LLADSDNLDTVQEFLDYLKMLFPMSTLGNALGILQGQSIFVRFFFYNFLPLVIHFSTNFFIDESQMFSYFGTSVPLSTLLFDYDKLGRPLLFFFVQLTFFLALFVLIERPRTPARAKDDMKLARKSFHSHSFFLSHFFFRVSFFVFPILLRKNSNFLPALSTAAVDEDDDVRQERARVLADDDQSTLLVGRDLRKRFGSVDAVKNITFGIKEGECFGLLGPNSAGKSTTIAMLTA
jgi:hypothetical protein